MNSDVNTTQAVDGIEKTIYASLKPLGFRKFGRTLHRFVSGDISQVINLQTGMPVDGMTGIFCVNLGIRVPECEELRFDPVQQRKYYPEYCCTIRSRLSMALQSRDVWFDLREAPDRISASIISDLERSVLPFYDALSSREEILAHRREYPQFDDMSYQILLDECFIYGHLGDMSMAKKRFEEYYQNQVDEYNDKAKNGSQIFLKKGETLICGKQHITAEKDGYVTAYDANHRHIDYLDKLAVGLKLR